MAKQRKLPKRLQRIVDRVRAGETLCVHLHHKQTGECERIFHFEPSGQPASPRSSAEAITSGLLRPGHDGLFGPSDSQTWKA